MSRIALLLLALTASLAATLSAGEAKPLKIGLLCSGSTTDGGWNQLAKEGLDQLKKSLGAQVSLVQKVSQDKAGDVLRDFAADGCQLVIAHGYEFLNPATEAAKAIPATRFAVSGADVAKPGIVTLDYDVSQASYQIGIIAGTLTKSGRLGYIGGARFPSVQACYRGFVAGAKSVRADVTVTEAYTSWDNAEQNKGQAEAFIKEGIDLIYPNVDAASRGVFEAVKAANARKEGGPTIYAFGCVGNHNANPICPQFILASAVIGFENSFRHLAEAVRDGKFQAGVIRENIATGTCIAVLNPALVGRVITAELKAKVDASGADLATGKITIPAP